jgi:hypothetical protein
MRRSVIVVAVDQASAEVRDSGADTADELDRTPRQWRALGALQSLTLRLGDWDRLKLWSPE